MFELLATRASTVARHVTADALLEAPNLQTSRGRRDYALLLFLYNTGARAEEAARLTIGDITWGGSPAVRLVGKGNKIASAPSENIRRMSSGCSLLPVAPVNSFSSIAAMND